MKKISFIFACGILSGGAAFADCSTAASDETKYCYDALGRLVEVNYGDEATTNYTYDAAGNRTEVITDGETLVPDPDGSQGSKVIVVPLGNGFTIIPIT